MSETPSRLRQIKASAGSGKTYALTGNILSLLAGASERELSGCLTPGADLYGWPEILGVTFTNRAALEMKERVLDRLKAAALDDPPGRVEAGWTREKASLAVDSLLRDAGALNIRTIDSLIHLIVRLAALDLDLPPDFQPSFDDADVFAPLLDDMAEQAREGDDGLLRDFSLACAQLVNYGNVRGFLAGGRVREGIAKLASLMLAHPEFAAARLSGPEEILAYLTALRADMRESCARLHHLLRGQDVNKRFLAALEKSMDADLPVDRFREPSVYFLKKDLDECMNKGGRGGAGEEALALFPRAARLALTYSAHSVVLHSALRSMPFVRLARRLVRSLADWQHKSGLVPASRVPALAGKALSGEYGVNESFCRMGNRLTHILVDEFQDTSRDQWRALRFLAEEALARNGTLTIVGDVKQAIYGWRGGDADLFDEVPEDAGLARMLLPPPARSSLDCNWRSRDGVIAWNNLVFSRLADPDLSLDLMRVLMGPRADDGEVALAADKLASTFRGCAQRADKAGPGGLARLTFIPEENADDALAELLPKRVRELGERHAWRDITILTRRNEENDRAARWLLAEGIPVVTQGSLLLAEHPLIAQSVALLEFLAAPDDDLAFWTLLAGQSLLPALPGLDRAALEQWAAGRLTASGTSGGGEAAPGLARAFRAAFPQLWEQCFAPLCDEAGLLTPYDTVREMFLHWRVRERYPEASGFLLRFLEVLHLAEQRGCADLSSFVAYWRDKGRGEKAPLPESMDAVRIMTIHKAKGLEAEAVLVPWHNFNVRASADWVPWRAEGIQVVLPLSRAMGKPYDRDKGKAAREALHLLYVAWTRAVSELHCFVQKAGGNVMNQALDLVLGPLLAEGGRLRRLGPDDWLWGEPPSPAVLPSAHGRARERALPEHELPAGGDISPESGAVWRPMHWLPRLQIFRSRPEDWTDAGPDEWPDEWTDEWPDEGTDGRSGPGSGRRRGILLHRCLEYLRISGDARGDALRAVRGGLAGLSLRDRAGLEQECCDALRWYAGLPEAARWLRHGIPEHGLLGTQGESLRVDLLVDDGLELLAVEYKSGGQGVLPKAPHLRQLEKYLALLARAERMPVRGVLVYLDRRELFFVDAPGGTEQEGAA